MALCWFVLAVSCLGDGMMPSSLGLRFGASGTSFHELYSQGEALARWDLFGLSMASGRRWFDLNLEGTAGALNGQGNTGFVGSLGPILGFAIGRFPLQPQVGISPTYISRKVYDLDDFGSNLQFTSHAGFGIRLSARTRLDYRFQHMSNANLGVSNPGLDLHALSVAVSF